MNSDNVTERLNAVRELLHQLGEGVVELAKTHPDVFDDPQLKKEVEDFQNAYQEAKTRLETPKLSIATLGTTSSGKSTIVNALIGRRIAPIERSEMSGGVLKFKDSDKVQLVIEDTQNAQWETGKWTDLTDEELYNRIQQVMWSYHETRKQRTDCLAPQITVQSQLLPVRDRAVLNLPEGIDLEIIDLPGLKSVQDRANLKVIQPQVRKSCSLVALDYGQVDEEHRQRLLQELKEVVEYLNGRTDSMIFVLNRVDMRGADDFPLDQQIERLKAEIQSVLSLDTPPDVIPFNARLLYYAQCAWGMEGGHLDSKIDPETRLKLLKAMFKDCANIIEEKTENDDDLDEWFYKLRKQVKKGQQIEDETMRKILRYAQEWSGGQQLWNTLRYRIQESFPELVIAPALNRLFKCFDSLSTKIDSLTNIRQIEDLQEIEKLRKQLENTRKNFIQTIENLNDGKKLISKGINDLKNSLNNQQDDSIKNSLQVQSTLVTENIEKFRVLDDAILEIRQDITLTLIRPVRKALQEKESAYELEDQLQEVISPIIANQIARAYESMKTKLNNFAEADGYLIKSARKDDKKAQQELDHAEKSVRMLFSAMREAILTRAEFTLQAQVQKFEQGLEALTKHFIDNDFDLIRNQLDSSQVTYINESIFAEFWKRISSKPPEMPEYILNLSDLIEANEEERRVKVGQQKKQETYEEGSCFFKEQKTRERTVDVYGEVEFKELKLPNFETMAEQWAKGIDNAGSDLCDELERWIFEYLNLVEKEYNYSIEEFINLVNRNLDKQQKLIETKSKQITQDLEDIENVKVTYNALIDISQRLNTLSQGDLENHA